LVTFIWKYTENETVIIDKVTLNSSDIGVNLELYSNLSKPYNGWPIGNYEIEILVSGDNNDPVVKHFEVR
jgi:hypothetical protein